MTNKSKWTAVAFFFPGDNNRPFDRVQKMHCMTAAVDRFGNLEVARRHIRVDRHSINIGAVSCMSYGAPNGFDIASKEVMPVMNGDSIFRYVTVNGREIEVSYNKSDDKFVDVNGNVYEPSQVEIKFYDSTLLDTQNKLMRSESRTTISQDYYSWMLRVSGDRQIARRTINLALPIGAAMERFVTEVVFSNLEKQLDHIKLPDMYVVMDGEPEYRANAIEGFILGCGRSRSPRLSCEMAPHKGIVTSISVDRTNDTIYMDITRVTKAPNSTNEYEVSDREPTHLTFPFNEGRTQILVNTTSKPYYPGDRVDFNTEGFVTAGHSRLVCIVPHDPAHHSYEAIKALMNEATLTEVRGKVVEQLCPKINNKRGVHVSLLGKFPANFDPETDVWARVDTLHYHFNGSVECLYGSEGSVNYNMISHAWNYPGRSNAKKQQHQQETAEAVKA